MEKLTALQTIINKKVSRLEQIVDCLKNLTQPCDFTEVIHGYEHEIYAYKRVLYDINLLMKIGGKGNEQSSND